MNLKKPYHNIMYKAPLAVICVITFLSGVPCLYAHGVLAGYTQTSGIKINAVYDSGEPMSGGQVMVFAPDNPAKAWLRGTLDDQGEFSFVPDKTIPGTWSVQVRQAGHGAMIHIPVEDTGLSESIPLSARQLTTLQLALMISCVSWGFLGTALYFKRKT